LRAAGPLKTNVIGLEPAMSEIVRKAKESDYVVVNAILEEDAIFHVNLEPDWVTDCTGISISDYSEWLTQQNKELLVLEVEGEVIGVLQLKVGEGGDPNMKYQPYGWIDEIAISEHKRDQGFGRKLMDASESWAKEKGLKILILDVWKSNKRALAVYARHGYSTHRERMFKEIK